MKKFATTLSVLAVAVSSMVAKVSAEVKIASVNMQELQIMFHERVSVEARLQRDKADAEEEIKKRGEKLRALAQQLADLQKQSDPTLSEQAIAKLRAQGAAIKNEFDAERQEYETFVQRRRIALQTLIQHEVRDMIEKIRQAVVSVAEAEGVDVVVDTATATQFGPSFPYVKPSLSITDKVAAKLNVNAPADFDAKAELQKARGGAAVEPQDAPNEGEPLPAPPVR